MSTSLNMRPAKRIQQLQIIICNNSPKPEIVQCLSTIEQTRKLWLFTQYDILEKRDVQRIATIRMVVRNIPLKKRTQIRAFC
jgi:hypothetical protein